MAKLFCRWDELTELIPRMAGRIPHSIGQMYTRKTLTHLQQQVVEESLYFACFMHFNLLASVSIISSVLLR